MKERTVLTDPAQIPQFSSEEEEAAFWQSAVLAEEFWAKCEPMPESELPTVRRLEDREGEG